MNDFRTFMQSNKFDDMDSRVATGKGVESKILDALNKTGWTILPATTSEDKYQKVDGWLKTARGPEAVQVKYRDRAAGNDILVEVIRHFSPEMFTSGRRFEFTGRDMVGVF